MKAIVLFLAFVACVYACPDENYLHRYYYIRVIAKVKVNSQDVTKGLRVELVSNSPWDPKNVTVLASANTEDRGYYVIAALDGCYPDTTYGLRLYADSLSPHSLEVGQNQDQVEVPRDCEYLAGQPVKDCKKSIVGQLKPTS